MVGFPALRQRSQDAEVSRDGGQCKHRHTSAAETMFESSLSATLSMILICSLMPKRWASARASYCSTVWPHRSRCQGAISDLSAARLLRVSKIRFSGLISPMATKSVDSTGMLWRCRIDWLVSVIGGRLGIPISTEVTGVLGDSSWISSASHELCTRTTRAESRTTRLIGQR